MNPLQRLVLGSVMITLTGMMQVTQPGTSAAIEPCGVRLTLTTALPVTTADVTGATSVFVTPFRGGQCAFYDGTSVWTLVSGITEVTVTVPSTTATMYDVFCFNNAGVMACDSAVAWTNDTTRATALATQNGVYVKSGTTTRRYIGSFRTTTVSGQTEDSITKRYLSNYYNRVRRWGYVIEATASWTYGTGNYRQTNNAAANQIAFVIGVSEDAVQATATGANSGGTGGYFTGLGLDSTTVLATGTVLMPSSPASSEQIGMMATLNTLPAVGFHYIAWLEKGSGSNATWVGGSTTGLAVSLMQ